MADTIPHFDVASHKSAAGAGGGHGARGRGGGERRKGRQVKGRGGRKGIGEWWSMITQFVSGG